MGVDFIGVDLMVGHLLNFVGKARFNHATSVQIDIYHNFVIAGIPGVVDIHFQLTSDLHSPTPTFTLTCVSNGGPVTYANWTKDGIPVPQNRYHLASHSLVNAQVATYHSTLSITGRLPGLYRCEVSSVRPDRTVTDAQDLDIVGELVLYYDTWQQILAQPLHHHQLIIIPLQVPTLLPVSLLSQLVPPVSESPGLLQPQEPL